MHACLETRFDDINLKKSLEGAIVFKMLDVRENNNYDESAEMEMEPTEEELRKIDEEQQIREDEVGKSNDNVNVFGKSEADFYLRQISSYEICSKEEEIEYFKKIAAGDKKARDEFAERNLKLVVSNAKNLTSKNAGFSMMDLIQEGNMGLLKAIDQFDISKGYKFSTYATWWIRQSMFRGFADKARTIRVPVHMAENIRKYRRVILELTQINGYEPSYEEIAERLGISVEKVELLAKFYEEPISLSTPIGEDEDTSLGDLIESEEQSVESQYEKKALYDILMQALNSLSDREKEVIVKRFGIGTGVSKTLEELGKEYGVTRERIRQIEGKALRKLRFKLSSKAELMMFFN